VLLQNREMTSISLYVAVEEPAIKVTSLKVNELEVKPYSKYCENQQRDSPDLYLSRLLLELRSYFQISIKLNHYFD